jgi:16S rRNA (uracil1498-N3)-methyltransferase
MQRYFAKSKTDEKITLYDSDRHHIKNVMRNQISDQIEVVYENIVYICSIQNLNPLELTITDTKKENPELNTNLVIAVSLVNEQKFDLILQKLTELGVSTIITIKTDRSIVKLDNQKITKKITRWQTICKEASEQSKRNIIPKVHNIVDLHALCEIKADLKILLSVNEKTKSVKKILQENKTCDTIIIVVGPEGGFSDQEEEKLIDNGFIRTSLGTRVLRTETAAIVFVSCVNYEWMV